MVCTALDGVKHVLTSLTVSETYIVKFPPDNGTAETLPIYSTIKIDINVNKTIFLSQFFTPYHLFLMGFKKMFSEAFELCF
jgi:hypothetical protein